MRAKSNLLYVFVILASVALMALFIDISPGKLLINRSVPEGVSAERRKMISDTYSVAFKTEKKNRTKAKLYIPIYRQNSDSDAKLYAALFEFDSEPQENENAYIFRDGEKILEVDKYLSRFKYANNSAEQSVQSALSGENEAEAAAREFIQSRTGVLNLTGAEISREGSGYIATFHEELDGLPLYDFTAQVELSEDGAVLSMELYYYSYEKISSNALYTAEECVYFLSGDEKAVLRSATLCYIFADSIIQPAYRFEGVTESGGEFVAFVPAARW